MSWIYRSAAIAALVCLLGGAATAANAQRGGVHFDFRGGSWSHHHHAGWHRYWGGPSIGFYWAPEPVYVVPGYDDPYYYSGPDYWYSNPSFGLSFDLGGGRGRDRDRDYHRDRGTFERGPSRGGHDHRGGHRRR